MLNRIMSKKVFFIVLIAPILLASCSNDQLENQQADGSDSYLASPQLKPLVEPDGLKLPKPIYSYRIYNPQLGGNVGKKLDIRPPLLPAPIVDNSRASYKNKLLTADIPQGTGLWNSIPLTLEKYGITIKSYSNEAMETSEAKIKRSKNDDPVEASFVIRRKSQGGRENITIELIKLTQDGRLLTDPIQIQYYVVNFFNVLMDGIAPKPVITTTDDKNPSNKSKLENESKALNPSGEFSLDDYIIIDDNDLDENVVE